MCWEDTAPRGARTPIQSLPKWKYGIRRMPGLRLEEPACVNTEVVAYSRVDGRVDTQQLQYQEVGGRSYLYVGHVFSGGTSILDVTTPTSPEVVAFIPSPNEHTWAIKNQVADDLLMVPCEASFLKPGNDPRQAMKGVRFFDVSDPTAPKELGSWHGGGVGVHRSWWNGGRYAYLSAGVDKPGHGDELHGERVLTILDVSDPENPRQASEFWLDDQRENRQPAPGAYTMVHEPIVEGDRAYVAYWDGGFAIIDVADAENPRLISHVKTFPWLSDGHTHTCVPLLDRNLLVVSDECTVNHGLEGPKEIMLWDISDETSPQPIAGVPMPEPSDQEPWDSYFQRGERFGPHCLHDNHVGQMQVTDKIYNAYTTAGVRVWDINDPAKLTEVASFVPPDPTEIADPRPYDRMADSLRGGRRHAIAEDVIIDPRGFGYVSGFNGGIWIFRERA